MNNKMNQIVTDIPTSEMSMTELLHNCCYVKNREVKYRDYSGDDYARDIVRELLRQYAVDDFPDVADSPDAADPQSRIPPPDSCQQQTQGTSSKMHQIYSGETGRQ